MGILIIISFLIGFLNGNSSIMTEYSNEDSKLLNSVGEENSDIIFNTAVKNIDWEIKNNQQTDNYEWTSSGWVFGIYYSFHFSCFKRF